MHYMVHIDIVNYMYMFVVWDISIVHPYIFRHIS